MGIRCGCEDCSGTTCKFDSSKGCCCCQNPTDCDCFGTTCKFDGSKGCCCCCCQNHAPTGSMLSLEHPASHLANDIHVCCKGCGTTCPTAFDCECCTGGATKR